MCLDSNDAPSPNKTCFYIPGLRGIVTESYEQEWENSICKSYKCLIRVEILKDILCTGVNKLLVWF